MDFFHLCIFLTITTSRITRPVYGAYPYYHTAFTKQASRHPYNSTRIHCIQH